MNNLLVSFQERYADLISIKQPDQKLYFIGGVVRDLFLNRDHKDIDILCDCDTRPVAKKFASQLNGSFFVLDEERNTSRVVINRDSNHQIYDFARLQGKNIHEDLAMRDFTINAMAIDFDHPDRVIDPLGGQKDLLEKKLRCCSELSFSRDPIRVMRAVRYSITCEVKIEPETLKLLKESVSGLQKISWERKRDEFLKTLETEKPALGLELMARLGILRELLGESKLDLPARFSSVAALHTLFNWVEGKHTEEANGNFFETSCNLRLGRFYPALFEYFTRRNSSDRNERQLALFASFLKELPAVKQEELPHAFLLSKEESVKVDLILSEAERLKLLEKQSVINAREVYRYFKEIDEVGLDIVFLELAEKLAQETSMLPQDHWLHFLEVCESLVEAWYEKTELVHPNAFLNGKDLMLEFDLAPGPVIGILLEKLREEQAAGMIRSREEAKCWVEDQLAHEELINR